MIVFQLVANGDDVKQGVLQEKPDLVVCDNDMPGLSGSEALAQVKQQWSQLVAIVVSAYPGGVRADFGEAVIDKSPSGLFNDLPLAIRAALQI